MVCASLSPGNAHATYAPDIYYGSYSINGQGDGSATNHEVASSWVETSYSSSASSWSPHKSIAVRHPSNCILLFEEPTDVTPNEAPPGGPWTIIDDGRWSGGGNTITVRHDGKGNVTFVDGHSERENYLFAQQAANVNPSFYTGTIQFNRRWTQIRTPAQS